MILPSRQFFSSFSSVSSSSRPRNRHYRHHHLLITSFVPVVNALLLISIIAHQFETVSSAIVAGDTGEGSGGTEDATSQIGNIGDADSSSTPSIITSNDNHFNNNIYKRDDDDDDLSNNNSNYYPSERSRAPAECTQEPRFSILTSESLLRSANVSYDERTGEIWTFGRIYLVLECRASRPIDLDFDGHLINKLQSVETTRTTYEDPRMPSCYSIAITVETNRESTGNFTCWSLQEPILSTSLYLFAHGGTPPYLLHSDIGNDIIEVETDIHDYVVTIPCVVTNPNISVALYKIEFEGFTLVPMGDHISYDPKRGFLLQVRKYPDPYGKYKCIAMNSSHFDVIVHVKPPTDNFFHDPIVQGRLEIVQDRLATQSFICNSSSQHPNIVTTADCKTPIDCRLAKRCLKKNPYCSVPCRCSVRGDKCSKTLESNYAQIGFPIDMGCATISANKNGGVVECSAKNFEPSADITYFIGLNGRIVQNWKSVGSDELVNVSTVYEMPHHAMFFVGEWIEFRCKASRFMFSRGFQWKFQLKNGTIIMAEAVALGSQVMEEDSYIAENMKVRISRADIVSVLCYAPIWNETGWVHNSLSLNVKDSIPPSFMNPNNVTVEFFVNNRNNSLVCEAEGFPRPDIMWFKDGEEYIIDLEFDFSVANMTRGTMILSELSIFDQGAVFTCNATNPKGTILKTFTLHLREESLRLSLIVTGVTFILLLGVLGIIIWIFYANSRFWGHYTSFTDQEVEDFFNGNPDAIKKCRDGVTKAIYQPYDSAFEVNSEDIEIDYKGKPLGEGQFGIVLKGHHQTKQGTFPVAVKTVKDNDPNRLRTLLTEIKIKMHIGKHENIVNLIGAVTKDLRKRDVSVIVEYCEFGNLEEYLRNHRGTFYDEFTPTIAANFRNGMRATPRYVRLECQVKTSDLIKWAHQIAKGMAYLVERKVIHGDVALRNMLLDITQTVKIADFGLSKHIYTQTTVYQTKKKPSQDTPLPWRWLAPETLKFHEFSFSSDAWSYGVLLHELFSLAEVPYVGLNYSEEFIKLLGNGYKLQKPAYANDDIYFMMRNCWDLDPKRRPTFTRLMDFFHQFIRMQHPINQSEIIQQMQYHIRRSSTELDTDSSDLDKEEASTMTSVLPTTTFSSFGSVSSILQNGQCQRPRGIAA